MGEDGETEPARGDPSRARSDPPVVVRVVRLTAGRATVLGVIHIVVLADRFELGYDLPVAR